MSTNLESTWIDVVKVKMDQLRERYSRQLVIQRDIGLSREG